MGIKMWYAYVSLMAAADTDEGVYTEKKRTKSYFHLVFLTLMAKKQMLATNEK